MAPYFDSFKMSLVEVCLYLAPYWYLIFTVFIFDTLLIFAVFCIVTVNSVILLVVVSLNDKNRKNTIYKNTRKRGETWTIKTTEQRQWRSFFVNFGHISHLFLVFPMSPFSSNSFEQVNVSWEARIYLLKFNNKKPRTTFEICPE